jgi:hypothetical protein
MGDRGRRLPGAETVMKRKVLIGLAAVIVIVLIVVAVRVLVYEPEIRDWYDLHAIRRHLDRSYVLMNDLDSTTAGYEELAGPTANGGKGWEPIGTTVSLPSDGDEQTMGAYPFVGSLDGQGHEIRDLFINRPYEDYVGLFRHVGEEGVVENVRVVAGTVTANRTVGGLVGSNRGTVNKCFFSGNLNGSEPVGGVVGSNGGGTVNGSYCVASVTGDRLTGGLAGVNTLDGVISDSYSNASVTGGQYVGGLVGANLARTISGCHATGSVAGESAVGGLVGLNLAANVSESYFSGNVTGDESVGGLVGHSVGTINNSHYNYDETLINGEKIVTLGALAGAEFEQWLDNDRVLDVNGRLSKEDGYYLINDIDDFKQLLAFGQDDSLKFRLNADIDLATEPGFYIPYLAGEFDGNGHKISNLSFNSGSVSNVGLFGYVAIAGEVTQLGVENTDITGFDFVGGVLGLNTGTVSRSYSSGAVTGHEFVGGLVGYSTRTVTNSYSSVAVTGVNHVGGLVGSNDDIVSNSYSSGNVTGHEYVGGLVGPNDYGGIVSNSFWDVETSGVEESDSGTGKNTTAMQDIATFSGVAWNITAVALNQTNVAYIWNIVNDVTYPFLSWE